MLPPQLANGLCCTKHCWGVKEQNCELVSVQMIVLVMLNSRPSKEIILYQPFETSCEPTKNRIDWKAQGNPEEMPVICVYTSILIDPFCLLALNTNPNHPKSTPNPQSSSVTYPPITEWLSIIGPVTRWLFTHGLIGHWMTVCWSDCEIVYTRLQVSTSRSIGKTRGIFTHPQRVLKVVDDWCKATSVKAKLHRRRACTHRIKTNAHSIKSKEE